jgi:carbon-monoxide dehydrogenase medium subunit
VIPAPFDYAAPDSLEEAIRLVAEGGEDAKLLAGGHSLVPLMKERLAAPALLVDLRRVPGLRGIERADGGFRIGAMTPHRQLEFSPELGLVSEAAGTIADPQVRHRGTIGGSIAHADPASDLPAVLLAAEATLVVQGQGDRREVPMAEVPVDYLETSLAPEEVITEVHLPGLDGYGFGYEKFNRRAEDWAMVAACALVKVTDGECEDVRVGLTHMGSVPLRAEGVEQALRGGRADGETIAEAAGEAAEGTDPPGDLNATPEYKRHLARVLTRRALERAAGLGG